MHVAHAARCGACVAQMREGRDAGPHSELRLVKVERFQRAMRAEAYQEVVYECERCSSRIMHTTDTNEFPPFWWFTD